MKKYTCFSTFSGIGAFEKGFDKINQPYDLYGYCEIDKYASKAYALIHNTDERMNYGDITTIDETKIEKNLDFFTYGFPCQDISLAGNQKGLVDEQGNKTRSGLVWDATRIIRASQPKIAIAENVKNLVGKKFTNEFQAILEELEECGYNNYWKVLNAKEHGVAQNRERVFIVSIRKDIDLGLFKWTETEELTTRLTDYLEDEVDEKYFLSDKQVKNIQESAFTQAVMRIHKSDGVMSTLLARDYKDPKCVALPTRIRKLTPKEYFRLMGFDDEDHDVVEQAGISNAQRYKMAGNSIVVNVVAKILKNLIQSTLKEVS